MDKATRITMYTYTVAVLDKHGHIFQYLQPNTDDPQVCMDLLKQVQGAPEFSGSKIAVVRTCMDVLDLEELQKDIDENIKKA